MTDEPRANLAALIAALIDALAAHEAAQRPQQLDPEPQVTKPTPAPALLSIPEAAKRLGISRSAAYRWVDSGDLPIKRLGGRAYVVVAHLNELIAVSQGEVA